MWLWSSDDYQGSEIFKALGCGGQQLGWIGSFNPVLEARLQGSNTGQCGSVLKPFLGGPYCTQAVVVGVHLPIVWNRRADEGKHTDCGRYGETLGRRVNSVGQHCPGMPGNRWAECLLFCHFALLCHHIVPGKQTAVKLPWCFFKCTSQSFLAELKGNLIWRVLQKNRGLHHLSKTWNTLSTPVS